MYAQTVKTNACPRSNAAIATRPGDGARHCPVQAARLWVIQADGESPDGQASRAFAGVARDRSRPAGSVHNLRFKKKVSGLGCLSNAGGNPHARRGAPLALLASGVTRRCVSGSPHCSAARCRRRRLFQFRCAWRLLLPRPSPLAAKIRNDTPSGRGGTAETGLMRPSARAEEEDRKRLRRVCRA